MGLNVMLVFFLVVVVFLLAYIVALGYSMFRVKSLKQILFRYESDKNSRPFFMRWTMMSWKFRRLQMRASVNKLGDQAMTRLIKYSGLFLLLICGFTVVMIVGILFFDF